ncbi:MAG TPA: prepilin peptidase [Clostridiales bacterium UBA8153]|nr:prepilin peptidase [Clostridiales bacterium UBA8153]
MQAVAVWLVGAAGGWLVDGYLRRLPWEPGRPGGRRVPGVELLCGFLVLAAYQRRGGGVPGALAGLMVLLLVLVSLVDLDLQIIPDELVGVGVLLGIAQAITTGLSASLIGGAIGFFALAVIALAGRGAMGGGDVKLMGALGLYLGFPHIVVALLAAFVPAAICAGVLLVTRLRKGRDFIPFGPFLAAGALVAMFAGEQILRWYLGR